MVALMVLMVGSCGTCAGFALCSSPSGPAAAKPGPAPASTYLGVRDEGYIWIDASTAMALFPSQDALERWSKAAAIDDKATVRSLELLAVKVTPGTRIRVLESGFIEPRRVEVLDGPRKGAQGWCYRDWLHRGRP